MKVLVVDDHSIVRYGIKTMLENLSGFSVVGEFRASEDAIAAYKDLHPEVVILDLNMPGPKDMRTRAIEEFKKLDPEAKIMILTMDENDLTLNSYFKAGALAVVSNNSSQEIIFKALKRLRQGQTFFASPPKEKNSGTKQFEEILDISIDPSRMLSPREYSVFKLFAQNKSVSEIAEKKGLDEATVEIYKHNIFNKLNVRDQQELVLIHGRGYR